MAPSAAPAGSSSARNQAKPASQSSSNSSGLDDVGKDHHPSSSSDSSDSDGSSSSDDDEEDSDLDVPRPPPPQLSIDDNGGKKSKKKSPVVSSKGDKTNEGTKRGASSKKDGDSKKDPYAALGRLTRRAYDYNAKPKKIIQMAVLEMLAKHAQGESRKTAKAALKSMDKDERKEYRDDYAFFLEKLPEIEHRVKSASGKSDLDGFAQKISNGMTNVRSTDTNIHKTIATLTQLIVKTLGETLNPPLPEDRGLLGYANARTAELLCPVDYIGDFRKDPEGVTKALKSGQSQAYVSKGDKLLWFAFDEDMYVPGDSLTGAFRSQFVIRLGRSILLGPVAFQSDTAFGKMEGRENNAGIMGMTEPSEEFIGYTTTLGRFLLSGRDKWPRSGGFDGTFDYGRFYRTSVGVMKKLKGTPWYDDLMVLWRKSLFDPTKAPKESSDSAEPFMDKSLDAQIEALKRASVLPAEMLSREPRTDPPTPRTPPRPLSPIPAPSTASTTLPDFQSASVTTAPSAAGSSEVDVQDSNERARNNKQPVAFETECHRSSPVDHQTPSSSAGPPPPHTAQSGDTVAPVTRAKRRKRDEQSEDKEGQADGDTAEAASSKKPKERESKKRKKKPTTVGDAEGA